MKKMSDKSQDRNQLKPIDSAMYNLFKRRIFPLPMRKGLLIAPFSRCVYRSTTNLVVSFLNYLISTMSI